MTSFWIALFFVLVAEMGDKTQLIALAFATRYKTSTVMAGVFGATLVIHLYSVVLGEAAGLVRGRPRAGRPRGADSDIPGRPLAAGLRAINY